MARPKKQAKIKEPIRLRTKTLANGNKSLYLDMYQNGKREYLFLRLYLIPETDQAAKTANHNTLQAANAIKAQKIIELANSRAGLSSVSVRSKIRLTDWVEQYREATIKRNPQSRYKLHLISLKNHLEKYSSGVILRNVTKEFCEEFIEYLLNVDTANGGKMTPATAEAYVTMLTSALNAAVRQDIIPANPMAKVDPLKKPRHGQSMREYLTIDEIKTLMDTSAKHENIKRAFLFCCFCGLRFSDVEALTWGNITEQNGQTFARIIVRKNGQPLHVPLSPEALRWIPERGRASDTDSVFKLKEYPTARAQLKKWIESTGIKKHVTFHVARHTFATLMLTLGADLYTTSKLLGHSKVTTTQIYAKIVDAKKVEAVNLVNNIFGKQ
ncbi:MAG: site-specific integrase [Bacteroides sp.]|nr:site-specific integrase [Bacteroides sp.]